MTIDRWNYVINPLFNSTEIQSYTTTLESGTMKEIETDGEIKAHASKKELITMEPNDAPLNIDLSLFPCFVYSIPALLISSICCEHLDPKMNNRRRSSKMILSQMQKLNLYQRRGRMSSIMMNERNQRRLQLLMV